MIAFTATWLLLGIIVILILLVLAINKKFKWNFFGLALAIYLLFSFIFLVTVSDTTSSTSTKKEARQSRKVSKPSFKIVSKKNSIGDYETDKDGNFNLKIKATQNGTIKVKEGEPDLESAEEYFKTVKVDLNKNKIASVTLHLNTDDPTHEYTIVSDGYKKHIEVYNNSDAYNSSESAEESSESANESSSSNSYQASLNARMNNWNSSSDGDTIKVKKVSQELHTTIVTVDKTDWKSLSTADKISFLEDWNDSMKELYSMSDKNGTTSIQVVSSSNKYDMLGHCTPTGKPKIDD